VADLNSPLTDAAGARASNAGDQFHELWALQQALELLDPSSGINAVTVEGVATEAEESNRAIWDGVDCALYFGGQSLESAARIDIAQHKYSSTDPDKDWTVARLTYNNKKDGNNSALRRLADAFIGAKKMMQANAELRVRFISNQNVAGEVLDAISAIIAPPPSELDSKLASNVQKIKSAAGLDGDYLSAFLRCLDFSDSGKSSRSSLRSSITQYVSQILGEDESATVRELMSQIRELMMPGYSRAVITRKMVLSWFGVTTEAGILPAQSDFKPVVSAIQREPTTILFEVINQGTKVVCLHGGPGCGKTTTLTQLGSTLPPSSVLLLFDCYGGGRYLFSNDRRHLPEHAFTQIANELSLKLGIPFLLARGSKAPLLIRRFLEHVKLAAGLLAKAHPEALLVLGVDAADNSITAAARSDPKDPCFVTELANADLSALPGNVRLVFSARTVRKGTLKLPVDVTYISCPPFSLEETKQFVARKFSTATDDWLEQFHALSGGVPRVQDYAMSAGNGDLESTLNALRPSGKNVADVLRKLFQDAMKRSGDDRLYPIYMSSIAALPAPIPPVHLAAVCGVQESEILDFIQDTRPSLRVEEDGISIADEDVEDFIRAEGQAEIAKARQTICDHFATVYTSDPYAAVNYADLLASAGRADAILPIIETDLAPVAIPDPIIKREVQLRRLRLAQSACRAAGNSVASMKVVLLSAEASKDEAFLADILNQHPDLSTRFARPSLVRLVLSDSDRTSGQGRVLIQDAARAARAGNHIQAREQLHYYDEWLERRKRVPEKGRGHWKVEIDDLIARIETIALLEGPARAYQDLMRWKPPRVRIQIALKLIPQLIARGNTDIVQMAVDGGLLPSAWQILLLVPLALSGAAIQTKDLERALAGLRGALIAPLKGIGYVSPPHQWNSELHGLVVTACEIGFSIGVSGAAIRKALNLIADFDRKFDKQSSTFEAGRLDILLRAWLLRRSLDNLPTSAEEFLNFVDPEGKKPKATTVRKRRRNANAKPPKRPSSQLLDDEQRRVVSTAFRVYASRILLLQHHAKNGSVDDIQIDAIAGFGYDDYLLKRQAGIGIKPKAALSVLSLMHLTGSSWKALFAKAATLASFDYNDPFAHKLIPLWHFLLLRVESRDFVLESLTERRDGIRLAREPASDKVNAAIEFSRLSLNFSEPDARAFFEEAVVLAQQIDREAMSQIEVIHTLTAHSTKWNESAKKAAVPVAVNVFTEISERLRNEEHFPWEGSMNSLVRLHAPTALAAVSRWSDQGTHSLSESLRLFLHEVIRLGGLSPSSATSLLTLVDYAPNQLKADIIAGLQSLGEAATNLILGELAADCLLLERPALIASQAKILQDAAKTLKGDRPPIFRRMVGTFRYLNARKTKAPKVKALKRKVPSLMGQRFVTPTQIEAEYSAARKTGGYFDTTSFLNQMIGAASSPGDRVPFLDALVASKIDSHSESTRATVIVDALSAWKSTPSVQQWRSRSLPSIIVSWFSGLTRWYYGTHRSTGLNELLEATHLPSNDKLNILAEALENIGLSLSGEALFGVAELMASLLTAQEAYEVFNWYLLRLNDRVLHDEKELNPDDLPENMNAAVGRFLFALMSDIDTRVRWRAAHAARRLARMGDTAPLNVIFANYDRVADDVFRAPAAPFYFLAARLWAVMVAARVANEAPTALTDVHTKLIAITLDETLPHLLIREHAKTALQILHDTSQFKLNPELKEKIHRVNVSPFKPSRRKENSHVRIDRGDRKDERFDFGYDTVEHMLLPILRMFVGLSKKELFDRLEYWLVDQWHAPEKVHYWDLEPRKARYSERDQSLSHSTKGSLPIIERHGFYLEWHAILSAVGEFLQKYPLWESEDRWGSFTYWLSEISLNEPPVWLSDLRDPKPLEEQLWFSGKEDENRWVSRVSRQDFLAALFPSEGKDRSIIRVDGSWKSAFPTRETGVEISSALVNPATASSLARALQMRENHQWGYHFPDERDDEDEFDGNYGAMPFKLAGWLVDMRDDGGLDKKDPFTNGISPDRRAPGKAIQTTLSLRAAPLPAKFWKTDGSTSVAVEHISWSDIPEKYDDSSWRSRETKSHGHLLQIQADVLSSFLKSEKMDLIIGVHIERRLEQEYGGRHGGETRKTKTFEKFFIFRADGTIEDYQGSISSWRSAR
jgi:hypothetical protein